MRDPSTEVAVVDFDSEEKASWTAAVVVDRRNSHSVVVATVTHLQNLYNDGVE